MGLLDGLIGGVADFLGLGGGGGGGSSVTYGVISTIQGGDKPVQLVSTIGGSDKPVVVDVGLDDVNVDVGGTGTPLHTVTDINVPLPVKTETDVDVEFAFTKPIVSDISSKLDVEPVQVDLCLNVGLTKLPKAHIRQPYESHFGVTVLGTELVGFNWRGESNVVIDELSSRPHVEPGREVHTIRPRPSPRRRPRVIGTSGEGGGLRIRFE